MNIIFHTNLDAYNSSYFPTDLTFVPRIGEKVAVNKTIAHYLRNKKLPTRLEVVDVIYHEDYVECELWYNQQDKQIADAAGAKTL